MSNIKYSIIIPVYNAEKFLKECLFSVLSSDRSDIEIIAIDDGSTDNSLQILKSIQSLDHRLMIFSQKNAGVSAARNKGLLEATGEWILFLDSDDYFTTEPFNYFDWIIASHINCKVFYFSSKADKAISMDLFRQDVVLATLGTRGIKNEFTELCQFSSVWSRLYNSNDIKTNGMTFDTDLVMGEDLFFNLKIQSFVKEIVLSTFSYYFYRNNSDSITHKLNTEIPLKDCLFQHKLLKYCESNNFKKVIDLAYNKSVLEGILVSCNTCFHRYPWNQYITARRAFFQFINQEPYKTILKKKINYRDFNILQGTILWCAKHNFFFPGYFIRSGVTLYQNKK